MNETIILIRNELAEFVSKYASAPTTIRIHPYDYAKLVLELDKIKNVGCVCTIAFLIYMMYTIGDSYIGG